MLHSLIRLWRSLIFPRRPIAAIVLAWCSLPLLGCDNGIHTAALTCNLERVRELLKENPDLVYSRDSSGWTALQAASMYHCIAVMELLLAYKADVDAREENSDGMTALHLAGYLGSGSADYTDVATILIAHGANMNARDSYGYTPLHQAAIHNHAKVAELLISHGADVNATDTVHGTTPLHYSVDRKFFGMTELLLTHGANVNARDDDDYTPLHYAAQGRWWDSSDSVKQLVELLRRYGGHD